jgi:hypothetical protein
MSTVTMQELELEHAELLPSRETLGNMGGGYQSHGSGGFSFNQFNASNNGNGDGNVHQFGGGFLGNVAIGNGNLNGNLSGNNVQIF